MKLYIKTHRLLKILIPIAFVGYLPVVAYAVNSDASQTRSVGNSVDDQTLALKATAVLNAQISDASFTITSYKQELLLAGQVPNVAAKTKAENAVLNIIGVKTVWNYLTIEANEDAVAIAHDSYLTTLAKGRLVAQRDVNANNITVVTVNKAVYLLGRQAGGNSQLQAAIDGIKEIDSVKNVVNLIGK